MNIYTTGSFATDGYGIFNVRTLVWMRSGARRRQVSTRIDSGGGGGIEQLSLTLPSQRGRGARGGGGGRGDSASAVPYHGRDTANGIK